MDKYCVCITNKKRTIQKLKTDVQVNDSSLW